MLFEPPIDELVKKAGCRYAVAVIVGARAKDLENKIPTLLNGSANLAKVLKTKFQMQFWQTQLKV